MADTSRGWFAKCQLVLKMFSSYLKVTDLNLLTNLGTVLSNFTDSFFTEKEENYGEIFEVVPYNFFP